VKFFQCPNCGHIPSRKEDRTILVQCTECGYVMTGDDVLPAENPAVEKKRSAEIIFKGDGWTPKGDEK